MGMSTTLSTLLPHPEGEQPSVEEFSATAETFAGRVHVDYCASPLLSEPWILDIDSTIKPLYGQQEGAMVGYNPQKPGRPSHCYHTYLMANLRLVLGVDVQPGDEHTAKHGQAGLWSLLHRLGRNRWPALLRGDVAWGVEPVMARAEQEGLAYLFRLRMTANVKRALTKMMAERDWTAAGHGWQGKETTLRLVGWSNAVSSCCAASSSGRWCSS